MSDSHFYLLCCRPHLYPESVIRNVMALDECRFAEIKELGLSGWIQDGEKGTAKICKMGERSRIHWKQKITVWVTWWNIWLSRIRIEIWNVAGNYTEKNSQRTGSYQARLTSVLHECVKGQGSHHSSWTPHPAAPAPYSWVLTWGLGQKKKVTGLVLLCQQSKVNGSSGEGRGGGR